MVEFGTCRLDVATRELWRDGELVHLEPKAFDVLAFLLEQRDRVVPNGEILDAVWGDRFVSESALTTRIKEIRRAVGDDGERQEVIANVRGRGYRFVAAVATAPAAPGAASTLVGRVADLAEVTARLLPGAVVTVVGPGGVGKTTLARAVCASLQPPPEDGVILVELAELTEPAAVVAAVARAAEVVADEADLGLLARTLAPLDAVLVLDNCEHVVAEAARVANRLLEPAGRLRLLATSRERLGLPGEVVWPLLPLRRDAAADLFVRRARAALPSFSPDGVAADLAAILAALDDLPLAIEMAAARVTSSSLAELRAEVETDRTGLRSPDRSSAPRHRTLADVVAWSADRLTAHEQELFAGLSAFAGPVGFDDVRRMLGDPPGLRPALAELVDRSLLVAEPAAGGTRFRMLETVRAVAVRRAGPVLGDRHARWTAEVAAECDAALRGHDERWGVARFDELAAELRSAQRWALANDHELAASLLVSVHQHAYWRLWPEPSSWARELLALEPVGRPSEAAALVIAGDAANRDRLAEARSHAELARRGDDLRVRAAALEVLADLALYGTDLDQVAPLATELREVGEALGDVHMVAIALVDHALAAVYAERPAEALPAAEALDALRPQLGPSDAAWSCYVRAELSPPEEAVGFLEEVLALASSVDNHLLVSVGQDSLGAALCRTGRLDEAADVLEACVTGFLRHAHHTQVGAVVHFTVDLLARSGDEEGAAALAEQLERLRWSRVDGERVDRDAPRDAILATRDALARRRSTA